MNVRSVETLLKIINDEIYFFVKLCDYCLAKDCAFYYALQQERKTRTIDDYCQEIKDLNIGLEVTRKEGKIILWGHILNEKPLMLILWSVKHQSCPAYKGVIHDNIKKLRMYYEDLIDKKRECSQKESEISNKKRSLSLEFTNDNAAKKQATHHTTHIDSRQKHTSLLLKPTEESISMSDNTYPQISTNQTFIQDSQVPVQLHSAACIQDSQVPAQLPSAAMPPVLTRDQKKQQFKSVFSSMVLSAKVLSEKIIDYMQNYFNYRDPASLNQYLKDEYGVILKQVKCTCQLIDSETNKILVKKEDIVYKKQMINILNIIFKTESGKDQKIILQSILNQFQQKIKSKTLDSLNEYLRKNYNMRIKMEGNLLRLYDLSVNQFLSPESAILAESKANTNTTLASKTPLKTPSFIDFQPIHTQYTDPKKFNRSNAPISEEPQKNIILIPDNENNAVPCSKGKQPMNSAKKINTPTKMTNLSTSNQLIKQKNNDFNSNTPILLNLQQLQPLTNPVDTPILTNPHPLTTNLAPSSWDLLTSNLPTFFFEGTKTNVTVKEDNQVNQDEVKNQQKYDLK